MLLCLAGCSNGNPVNAARCAKVQTVLKSGSTSATALESNSVGLLLLSHYDLKEENLLEPLTQNEVSTQCNASLQLLETIPPKVRVWTASHCIKPLLLKSITLAVRNRTSASGKFYKWKIEHPLIKSAERMRRGYSTLAGGSFFAERSRLFRAFDRRSMLVEGSSAVLTPRVSCENLRWSQPAADRHSLCFSIFDLMNLDFYLPDPESDQSKLLLSSLKNSPVSASTLSRIALKRETFLRRMHVTSQSEWIIHEGNRIRQFVSSFPRNSFPFFSDDVLEIENLNREVFSLPHPEESQILEQREFTTQDAVPPAVNTTYLAHSGGRYSSPRTTIDGVAVTCHRPLRRYNSVTGQIDTLPELEVRPHEFCPGGSKFQPDHFWNRDRPWSWMMADMTHGAAREFSKAIVDIAAETTDTRARLDRFEIASTFGLVDDLGMDNILAQIATPLYRHLRLPFSNATDQIIGLETFEDTGAFLLSSPRNSTRVRFVKGDSGSIVHLDGVPIATLYSVDGEETSGGSSLLPVPVVTEDASEDVSPSSNRKVSFKTHAAPETGCK